jgi:hypothetical protein
MASRSFCTISPCILLTVKLASLIFSVSQSTFLLVLQKITACVIVNLLSVIARSEDVRVVEITESVEFPVLLLDSYEELLDALESQLVSLD